MPGPAPKPVETKIREGNPGHQKLAAPTLIGGRLTVEDLATLPLPDLEPWQLPAWHEIVTPLAASGLLDRADLPAVEAAARALSLMREADKHLRDGRSKLRAQEPKLFHTNSQGRVAHWAIGIRQQASAEFRQWAQVLGIGPANRTKLGVAGAKPEGGMAGELGRTLPKPARLRVIDRDDEDH